MASWVATYTNDFGVTARKAGVSVYANVEGSRQSTTRSFDLRYLPPVAVAAFSNGPQLCAIVSGTRTIRSAECWITTTESIVIPCIWRAEQTEFSQFYRELVNSGLFRLVIHQGEQINDWYTRVYAT